MLIERETNGSYIRKGNRLIVKRFASSHAAHGYMLKHNTGSGRDWRESTRGLPAGTYAYAGGHWHNVRNLDPSTLNHI